MRALFLPRWYPNPGNPYDGVFAREHALAARAAGVDVAVLHMPDVAAPIRGLWQMEEETDPQLNAGIPTYHVQTRPIRIPGSRVLSFRISSWLQLWAAWRAFRRIRSRGFQPDVVHAHVYTASSVAGFLGRRFGLPVVIAEHSTAFPRGTIPAGALKRARAAFLAADRVLPVSASLQKAMEAAAIEARFDVVPNAVDTSLFHPAEPGRRARPRGEPRRMIFVGSLEPTEHKGFPTLIEALKLLRDRRTDWTLDVVGDGPSRADLTARVGSEGLAQYVAFLGSLPKSRIAEMMRASDLFVMPSNFETQGVVILESMCSGIPIVSTAVGGIPEIVSPADGILVQPRDPAALARALESLLSDPGRFDGRAIAARAAARFGYAAVGSRLAAIYADVARARGRPLSEPAAAGEQRPG
jgi:glycosyltransferase involved in cell wall biosynthesis